MTASGGYVRWRFKTGNIVHSSPTVVDGTVFVGSADNNLYAVDVQTGTEQWCFNTGNSIHSSPTVVDGTVFVAVKMPICTRYMQAFQVRAKDRV